MGIHRHYWWPTWGRHFRLRCPKCSSETEYLVCLPARSKSYLNRIYLCLNSGCRWITPA